VRSLAIVLAFIVNLLASRPQVKETRKSASIKVAVAGVEVLCLSHGLHVYSRRQRLNPLRCAHIPNSLPVQTLTQHVR